MGMMKNHRIKNDHVKLYRNSKIGECLVLSLNSLIDEGKITGKLALSILEKFDWSLLKALQLRTCATVKLKGQIQNYNNIQNVWVFNVKNALITIDEGKTVHGRERYEERVDFIKITCVDDRILNG